MKARDIRVQARRDVEMAADWLQSTAGDAVARDFLLATRAAFQMITDHPESGSARWSQMSGISGLRSWPLHGFPYLLFYTIVDRKPRFLRVLHSARDIPLSLRP
jgi:toxin ParE1/3/4